MHPGALIPDIDHLEKIGVQARLFTGTSKKRFMGPRGAGGDHDAVKSLLLDSLFDLINAALGTGIEVPLYESDEGKVFRIFCEFFHIQISGDIGAAVADKYPDPDVLIFPFRQRLAPLLIGTA
jgi:hypothetical protein